MGRNTRITQGATAPNPTTKYFEWKSKDKCFSYYDKESKQNVQVKLPFKFVFLDHFHTVKGWSDENSAGIYANEVKYIGNQPMNVRTFKTKTRPSVAIANGIYKEIKPDVVSKGGKYHRSIYIMLEDGSVANISLKGSGVSAWSEFFNIARKSIDGNWVEVAKAKSDKKGSVSFTTPDFNLGANLSAEESALADNADRMLEDYMDGYFAQPTEKEAEVVEVDDFDDSDLDF